MSSELTLNASIAFEDSEGSAFALQVIDFIQSISTKKFIHLKQNIGITEEALYLGELTSLGYAMFLNWDQTNYVELRVATAGTKFATLKPAISTTAPGFALLFLGSGITAPYAIANSAACQVEYAIWSQ